MSTLSTSRSLLSASPAIVYLLLASIFHILLLCPTLVSSACPKETDENNVVPFPPSLRSLPQLRLLEYNGNQFKLTCQLKVCSITKPITYKWMFQSDSGSDGEQELVREDHELSSSQLYHFQGSDIYIHTAYEDWNRVTGYYWCEASNEHGKATSNKCQVDKTDVKQRKNPLGEVKVLAGESVRIKMEKPPPGDKEVPYTSVFYSLRFPNSVTEILKPNVALESRDGRFVIGANYDLYILEAKTSDSMSFGLMFREYETVTTFTYREGSLFVENAPFTGDNKGFFDVYKHYVFVRGEPGHLTCIPKKNTKVLFKKDGKEFDAPYDQSAKIYRSDFGLWFNAPTEADNGKYTCYLEEDPKQTYDQQVRVIGPPEIKCNYEMFVIRVPNSALEMECTVSSDYLTLNTPSLFWDDEPIEDHSELTLTQEITKDGKSYKIKLTSPKLSVEDTGVLRFLATAQPLNRNQVLTTLGFKMPADDPKVYFDDFRILPFEHREEVSIAVFTMPLRVNPDEKQRLDALMGEKDFGLKTTIFGSPLPVVKWFVEDKEILPDDANFKEETMFQVVFKLFIGTVEKNYTIKAVGTHEIEGVPSSAEEVFKVIAHKPIEWKADLPEEFNTFTGTNANAMCAATQEDGDRTADIEFIWLREADGSFIFDNTGGFQIVSGEMTDENNVKYATSNLTFMTSNDDQFSFTCNATMKANGHPLQMLSRNVSVASGNKPGTPKNFMCVEERKVFKYESERKREDYSYGDVVEYAQVYQETKSDEYEWKVLGTTKRNIGREGYFELRIGLFELTQEYEEPWENFPTGCKILSRVYTKNKYGRSDMSNVVEHITEDAEPTIPVTNVDVKPDPDGTGEIVVSWDPYPREDFGSYDTDDCCIHVQIESTAPDGTPRTKTLDCVDPFSTQIKTGWPDTEPFTEHKVTTWFSNDAGESDKTEADGYNYQSTPETPKLDQQGDDEPTSITVKFDAMSDDDVNGKFTEYELIVRDPDGNIVGTKTSTDQGTPPEELSLTVDGLTPYKDYTAELVVKNEVDSATTGRIPRKTAPDKPVPIDPDSIVVHVHPEGVLIYWKPTEPNGEFKEYLVRFDPSLGADEQTTTEPFLDATDIFFPDGNPVGQRKYDFEIMSRNHELTSDPTSSIVDFNLPEDPPGNPEAPTELLCDLIDPSRLGVKWTYEQFGKYASTHSVIYKVVKSDDDYMESCNPTQLTEKQECLPKVDQTNYIYTVRLVARNKYGAAASQGALCKTAFPAMLQQEAGGGVLAASAGLAMALILLLILLVLLVLIGVYYAKNRSHQYRVQRNESRFKPKDVEFLPRKDETNRFNEYIPDETQLPFISPHGKVGPLNLDDDSFNDPFGGDEDLDGYNEDGSFIGAYTNDAAVYGGQQA